MGNSPASDLAGTRASLKLQVIFIKYKHVNDPRKQKSLRVGLRKFQCDYHKSIGNSCEECAFLPIAERLFSGWKVIANYGHVMLGRIWIAHDDRIRMEVLS